MQGYVEGKRNRGRPKRNWMNDLTEYTHLSLSNLLEKPWNQMNRKSCVTEEEMCSPYDVRRYGNK